MRYGPDRVFVHVRQRRPPTRATSGDQGARRPGHPTVTINAHRARATSGACSSTASFATAVVGLGASDQPVRQPNVQEARTTARVLAAGATAVDDGLLDELLDGLAPPHYVATMGYLPTRRDRAGVTICAPR